MPYASRTTATTLAALTLGACAHYETATTYGMSQETARRLVGSPMLETTSETSVEGGFETATWHGRRRDHTVGGFGADRTTVTRTHCVQAAEIDYVQPVETSPVVVGRDLDVAGGIGLVLAGAVVYGTARLVHASDMDGYDIDVHTWNDQNGLYQMNPGFFPNPGPYPTAPGEPRGAYMAAAGVAIAGAAYLVYALASKPRGAPKPPAQGERRYTTTEYVEATGC